MKGKCHPKARVAVARKLAVVLHAMWRDGTAYVGDAATERDASGAWMAAKVQRLGQARS